MLSQLDRRAAAALLLFPASAFAQQPPTPWTVVGDATGAYVATVDTSVRRSGRASAHIASRVRATSGYVALTQTVSAEAYRGRRLLIGIYSRTRNLTGSGTYLYVSVRGATPDVSAYANNQSRARTGTTADWVFDTLSVVVPANATQISFGAIVEGTGDVWLDDVAVSVVGAPVVVKITDRGFETTTRIAGQLNRDALVTARATTARGLDAMIAFARLTGYVRFFYPADTVIATNWANFTTAGMPVAA